MDVTLTSRWTFDSAHRLEGHPGKCSELHGHTYQLEVTVRRWDRCLTESGMVVDFGELDDIVRSLVLDPLDHAFLNKIIPTPTAELIAQWIFDVLHPPLWSRDLRLEKVVLHETGTNWVTVKEATK